MRILIFILSISMAMPSWANFGSGMPSDHCAYNASPQRVYKPQSVIDAENKLEEAKRKLERLEKKLDRLDCSECDEVVRKVLSIVDNDNVEAYITHLEGGSRCSTSSNVEIYNYYAQIAGWETLPSHRVPITPDRMIAEDAPSGGGPSAPPATPEFPDGDDPDGGGELGRGTVETTDAPPAGTLPPPGPARPPVVLPGPSPECPFYAGVNHSLKPEVCEVAKPHISRDEYRSCRRCVIPSRSKPGGRYGDCLRETAMLEEQIAELEDRILDLEDELEDARDNAEASGESSVCADCMRDPRSGWERWGPMALMGGLTLAGAYFGYRQERKSYDHYRNVIHPDNNAKGYPTSPMRDMSGYRFASTLVGGLPMVINTGLASGAFGCSGSSMFGGGMIGSGAMAGSQMGGLMGVPTIFNGGLGAQGGIQMGGGIFNGNSGPWGAGGMGGGMGGMGGMGAGGGMASAAQIQARISQLNAYQSQLSQQAAWANSYEAITQNYQSQVQALGAYPTGSGAFGAGGGFGGMGAGAGVMAPGSNAVLTGGVNIGAHLGMGVGGGMNGTVTPPMMPGGTSVGTIPTGQQGAGQPFNGNVPVPANTQPGAGQPVSNPIGF